MKLVVRSAQGAVNELDFDKGPVYIGRQMGSQVFLPDMSVSRQHAVIFATSDGKWVIEDLDSVNKTYLNSVAIHKTQVKNGDEIGVADFHISVELAAQPEPDKPEPDKPESDKLEPDKPESDKLEPDKPEPPSQPTHQSTGQQTDQPVHMEDTIVAVRHDVDTVHRRLEGKYAEQIRLPARRFGDMARATATLCHAKNIKELHKSTVELMMRQLHAYNAWAAVRRDIDGRMDHQGGRNVSTLTVKRSELVMGQMVSDALDKGLCQLVPQLPRHLSDGKIRSAIAVPVMYEENCYGVLYAENSTDHEHYTMEEMDYLILLSIPIGAVIARL